MAGLGPFRKGTPPPKPAQVFVKVPPEEKEKRAAELDEKRTRTPVHGLYPSARRRMP